MGFFAGSPLDLPIAFLLHCKHEDCHTSTWLPHRILAHIAEDSMGLVPTGAVLYVCPQCRHVLSVTRHGLDAARAGTVSSLDSYPVNDGDHDVYFYGCSAATCTSLSVLYTPWTSDMSPEERQSDTATWKWDGCTCLNGHAIEKPGH